MWSIAENLHRAELTALERDTQLARWIELDEQWRAERERLSSQSETKAPIGHRPQGGTNAAARELGINRQIRRYAELLKQRDGSLPRQTVAATINFRTVPSRRRNIPWHSELGFRSGRKKPPSV